MAGLFVSQFMLILDNLFSNFMIFSSSFTKRYKFNISRSLITKLNFANSNTHQIVMFLICKVTEIR